MTLDEMLLDLNNRIGSEPEVDNSVMSIWLNQGLMAFCNTWDYHWLERVSYSTTISGQSKYALPSDFKRMLDLKVDGERYKYVRWERRDTRPSGEKHFSVLNEYVYISPTPDSTSDTNIEMSYIRRPARMTAGTDDPSTNDQANLPDVYHEALVLYAFSIYNTYDEEHNEARSLMGNELRPVPGTFYYHIQTARKEEQQRKRGQRGKMMKTKEFYGYSHPNRLRHSSSVLGN